MQKIVNTPCIKCGGDTYIHYEKPEESSGMDIKPLKQGGLKKTCRTCGFEQYIKSLDDEETNKMLADMKAKIK